MVLLAIQWEGECFGTFELIKRGYDGVISLESNLSKLPDELCETEEIALYHKARYIAALAAGKITLCDRTTENV